VIRINGCLRHSTSGTSIHGRTSTWANEQAALIRAGKFDQADIENIAEELETLGRSEARELKSRYRVLLLHLLKWRYLTTKPSGLSAEPEMDPIGEAIGVTG
jgi:hypothetical protein